MMMRRGQETAGTAMGCARDEGKCMCGEAVEAASCGGCERHGMVRARRAVVAASRCARCGCGGVGEGRSRRAVFVGFFSPSRGGWFVLGEAGGCGWQVVAGK